MKNLRQKAYNILRRSEAFFKTDMVYVAKGSIWLNIGQAISALIAFISALFFANFVSKDIYGNYKFVIATASIIGALSLTGMGTVVTQGVAKGFEGILKSAVKTTLKWSVIIAVTALSASIYYFINGNKTLGFAMLIAGVSLPITQSFGLYGSYLYGKRDFRRLTIYIAITQLFATFTVVAVAITLKSIVAMVSAYFFINALITFWAYRHTLKKVSPTEKQDESLIPYGKHLSVMGFFGTVANQMDKILVFHYLGAFELAIYAFAQAIPDQFKGVLKNLFGIALPKFATLENTELRKSIVNKFFQLTLFTTVAVFVYIISAEFIFQLLFPKYLESVFYSQIYMLGLITIPGISLLGIYFQLKKATRKLYELNIIGNTFTLIITFILIYLYGLLGAVIANGLSWLVMLLAHWYYFIHHE